MNFFGHPLQSHWESFRENVFIRSQNQNIFEKFKLNRNLQTIPFKMMCNISMLRHRFSNERGGGGGLTTFLSYSVKVCIQLLLLIVVENLIQIPQQRCQFVWING